MAIAARAERAEAGGRTARLWVRLGLIALALLIFLGLLSAGARNMLGGSAAARIAATSATMKNVATALESYRADRGAYPDDLSRLVGPYFSKEPLDSWSRPLHYRVPGSSGRGFTLASAGADGDQGTGDDIDWWLVQGED